MNEYKRAMHYYNNIAEKVTGHSGAIKYDEYWQVRKVVEELFNTKTINDIPWFDDWARKNIIK